MSDKELTAQYAPISKKPAVDLETRSQLPLVDGSANIANQKRLSTDWAYQQAIMGGDLIAPDWKWYSEATVDTENRQLDYYAAAAREARMSRYSLSPQVEVSVDMGIESGRGAPVSREPEYRIGFSRLDRDRAFEIMRRLQDIFPEFEEILTINDAKTGRWSGGNFRDETPVEVPSPEPKQAKPREFREIDFE